jgi:hypothetical protein
MSEFTSASLDPSASTPYVLSTKPVPASQVGSTPLPLDWTKMGGVCEDEVDRAPQDVVDYELDPADDHLSIVGTAGKKVTRIAGLEKMRLRVLVLRSHLIQSMEGCKEQTGLETLELYDNAVGELRDLEVSRASVRGEGGGQREANSGTPASGTQCFPKLTTLDISFNVIRSTAPIASLSLLTELYIANNKLATLEGLENLACLKTLDVGANRLRTMDGLGGCVSLEHLWMGKNKVRGWGQVGGGRGGRGVEGKRGAWGFVSASSHLHPPPFPDHRHLRPVQPAQDPPPRRAVQPAHVRGRPRPRRRHPRGAVRAPRAERSSER